MSALAAPVAGPIVPRMGRILPIVVSVLVVALAWFAPEGEPSHISANQAYELLALPVKSQRSHNINKPPILQCQPSLTSLKSSR